MLSQVHSCRNLNAADHLPGYKIPAPAIIVPDTPPYPSRPEAASVGGLIFIQINQIEAAFEQLQPKLTLGFRPLGARLRKPLKKPRDDRIDCRRFTTTTVVGGTRSFSSRAVPFESVDWPLLAQSRGNDSASVAFPTMLPLSAYAGLGMSPKEIAARYREHAASCIKVAAGLSEISNKLMLLDMAHAWIALAEQAEKNEALAVVYETPAEV
jgi:hypothetical protein